MDIPDMLLAIADYILQAIATGLVLIHPWFVRAHSGGSLRVFFIPFFFLAAWGVWRAVWFDPAIQNDVPDIGYILIAVFYSFVALALYGVARVIRVSIRHSRAKCADRD